MYLTLLFLILSSIWFAFLDYNLNNARTDFFKQIFNENNSSIKMFYSKTTSSNNDIDEITKILIGLCHMNQAQILICQECYDAGNTYCPYPTNSFCEEAKNVNPDDPNIDWDFLPGNLGDSGYITSLKNLPQINPNNMKSINDLSKAEIYRFNKVFTYQFYNPKLKYTKPNTGGSDPCAVEGIVHY